MCGLRHALVRLLYLTKELFDRFGLEAIDRICYHSELLSVLAGLADGSNAKHRFGRRRRGCLANS